MQAIKDGVARITLTRDEIFKIAKDDIEMARSMTDLLMKNNFIPQAPETMINEAFEWAIDQVKK